MSKQHLGEIRKNLAPLENSLASLGNDGVKYVSRLENVQGHKNKELSCLNELAVLCPSSPYAALALRGNKLYVAQNNRTPGVIDKEKLKEILKEQHAFADLSQLVSGEIEIEIVRYNPDGRHADMEAVSKAIESNKLTNEFEQNINEERNKPIYLGLARFDDTGKNIPHDPASCGSCFASIEALNKNGYNVRVTLATPYNFPSNFYKISSLILNDPIIFNDYLGVLKESTNILLERLKDEKASYVQYRVHDDKRETSEKLKRVEYEKLYDEISKDARNWKYADYSKFSKELREYITVAENAINQVEIAEANVAGLVQKQREAKEKILTAMKKVEGYETLKNNVNIVDKEKASKNINAINEYIKEYDKIIIKADNANGVFKRAAPGQKNNTKKSLESHQKQLKELREKFSFLLPKREISLEFESEKENLESEKKDLEKEQKKLKANVKNLNEIVKETLASTGASNVQELDSAIDTLRKAKEFYEVGSYAEALNAINNNKVLNNNINTQISSGITATTRTTTTTATTNPNLNSNLLRAEKENLTNSLLQEELNRNGKYNLNDRLAAGNDSNELLNKFDREAVITANIDIKAIDAKKSAEIGSVEIRAEHNHLINHADNTKALIAEIQNGKIDKNTVIAIERKQYGDNLGMKDVIKIANILEHNEKNPDNPLKLPEELENTPIFQDALLYKAAKENGIKVISLEGKNLEHLKDSPLHNENREQYMTDVINEVRSKGYNVIASVGSAHVANLEKALENQQKHDIRFNHISRKLRQEALNIPKAIPAKIVSMREVKKSNNTSWQDLVTSQSTKKTQVGRN
ncbi:hypothetical protein [Rickettsia endosymbiont of Halotydeus destructor]|uniref:hypothetical protein n=1 Tax=Rickettsia endosymbiont of Halotydeus destructor TaxID=2996754 RepID=UPI003BB10865